MSLKQQKWITREDLKSNRNCLYVFGDNEMRRGFGGQAKAMRGESNAIGIATKVRPDRKSDSYWTDDDYHRQCRVLDADFAPLFKAAQQGCTIVIPADGLGTGLSELSTRAPRTNAYLENLLHALEKACKKTSDIQNESQEVGTQNPFPI